MMKYISFLNDLIRLQKSKLFYKSHPVIVFLDPSLRWDDREDNILIWILTFAGVMGRKLRHSLKNGKMVIHRQSPLPLSHES
ncbi:MAG: hypothetical protein AAB309_03730, partial [Deltaproteobacteria bacterium]